MVYLVAIESEIETTLNLKLLLPLLRLLQYNDNIIVIIGVTLRNSSHHKYIMQKLNYKLKFNSGRA